MTNWNNKDKRISFLSIFRTLIDNKVLAHINESPSSYFTEAVDLTNKLFQIYPTDEVSPDIAELAESLEEEDIFEEKKRMTEDEEDLAGVDFGSEEEIKYVEEKKKPYNGNKKVPMIGDSFVGKTGDTMTYRACMTCKEASWFKGTYKVCYSCNMKKKK